MRNLCIVFAALRVIRAGAAIPPTLPSFLSTCLLSFVCQKKGDEIQMTAVVADKIFHHLIPCSQPLRAAAAAAGQTVISKVGGRASFFLPLSFSPGCSVLEFPLLFLFHLSWFSLHNISQHSLPLLTLPAADDGSFHRNNLEFLGLFWLTLFDQFCIQADCHLSCNFVCVSSFVLTDSMPFGNASWVGKPESLPPSAAHRRRSRLLSFEEVGRTTIDRLRHLELAEVTAAAAAAHFLHSRRFTIPAAFFSHFMMRKWFCPGMAPPF